MLFYPVFLFDLIAHMNDYSKLFYDRSLYSFCYKFFTRLSYSVYIVVKISGFFRYVHVCTKTFLCVFARKIVYAFCAYSADKIGCSDSNIYFKLYTNIQREEYFHTKVL